MSSDSGKLAERSMERGAVSERGVGTERGGRGRVASLGSQTTG